MRKFIDLVEKYSSDNTYLLHHLKNNMFDYHRYWNEIITWAEANDKLDLFTDDEGGPIEALDDPDVFMSLPEDEQREAEEWIMEYLTNHDPASLPSSHYFSPDKKLINRQTWLVHFSDYARDIYWNGFTHGNWDMDALGLTTYQTHSSKKGGGYNFAFEANSRHAYFVAANGKYGKHAVLFQNSGVKAWHHGDEEDQIIFWGPDVSPHQIILLTQEYGDWSVMSNEGKALYTRDFGAVVQWVIANSHQYSKVLYH